MTISSSYIEKTLFAPKTKIMTDNKRATTKVFIIMLTQASPELIDRQFSNLK